MSQHPEHAHAQDETPFATDEQMEGRKYLRLNRGVHVVTVVVARDKTGEMRLKKADEQ